VTARLIDGKAIAAGYREEFAVRVARLRDAGVTPGLAVVIVGDDPASKVYVRNKALACEAGIKIVGIFTEDLAVIGAGRGRIVSALGQPAEKVQRGRRLIGVGEQAQVLAQKIGGLAHDLGAVIGRGVFPDLETLGGGGKRRIEISFAGVWQMAQHFASGRIDHVLALATFAVEPFPVDEKLELGIHARTSLLPGNNIGRGLALSRQRGYDPRYAPPLTWMVCPVT